MEKRYISESRYKKSTTRKRRTSNTVKSNLVPSKSIKQTPKTKKVKQKIVKRKIGTKRTEKQKRVSNIIVCIILLVLIGIISRAILKDENEPFISFPFIANENEEIIRVGIITADNLLDVNTNNVVVNELKKYSKDTLLIINEDYSITYKIISDVTKVSNTEYKIKRDENSNVSIENIKNALEKYSTDKQSIYYAQLANIKTITIIDENNLSIKLKNNDPYFVYDLAISLQSANDEQKYVQDNKSTASKLIFIRHEDANKELPAQVIVNRYKDIYAAVAAYKEASINMLVTNAENVENILGKYEYNIKSYKNGNTLFLLSNPKSLIYKKDEVRQAIVYSIDRNGIISKVLKNKGEKIDLPYIYDDVKYKYDVYAAENMLLTNQYTKSNKVYSKVENDVKTTLELNLIVNKSDGIKVSVANRIKNNLTSIGIKVNVERLTLTEIRSRLKTGDYDISLVSVNLNNSPDISFLTSRLYSTLDVKKAISTVNDSSVKDLQRNIVNLRNILSNNISAIGIYSDVSYLVYSKDIVGIEDISYMNLFKNILS